MIELLEKPDHWYVEVANRLVDVFGEYGARRIDVMAVMAILLRKLINEMKDEMKESDVNELVVFIDFIRIFDEIEGVTEVEK